MRFRSPGKRSDEERILPLINVVFLLLIFFMLAGRLSAPEPFEVEPPVSRSDGEVKPQEMLVLVGADGRIALDGEAMDEERFQAAVAERAAGDDARVRLKADGRAEATRVVAVMELLREAGLDRVELLTVPGDR